MVILGGRRRGEESSVLPRRGKTARKQRSMREAGKSLLTALGIKTRSLEGDRVIVLHKGRAKVKKRLGRPLRITDYSCWEKSETKGMGWCLRR